MANRVTLKQLKKKMEKTRVTAALGPDSYGSLVNLLEMKSELTISQIIGDAIRFAFQNNMYDERRGLIPTPKETFEVEAKPIVVNKKDWCEKYGGTCDGINCAYTKYEVTASGVVVRNDVTMPVRSMPENEVDFRKSVLGGFITIHEAETAYANQEGDNFFDPSEIPSRKKVQK